MVHMATNRINTLFADVHSKIDKLSKQVKLYGALVAICTAAVPTYGQIKSAYADDHIESVVDARVEIAASKAADKAATLAAERAIQKYEVRLAQKQTTNE